MIRDKILIDGVKYSVDDIHQIPLDTASIATHTTDKHIFFSGRLSPYSNFYDCKMEIDGDQYRSVEQYVQHIKAVNANDNYRAEAIMLASDPAEMRQLGNACDTKDWTNAAHEKTMETAIRAKFTQNVDLRKQLMDTGNRVFAEANVHEKYWGIGIGLHNKSIGDTTKWNGKNHFGKLLTSIRDSIAT